MAVHSERPLKTSDSCAPSAHLLTWWAAGIGFLLLAVYAGAFRDLLRDWWVDNQGASYGILIPPLAFYIAYARRKRTFSIPSRQDARGLAVIFISCLMFLVGKLGAEYFTTRLSLIIMLTGLSLTFWGRARTRTLAFPLVLLATMIPLPMLIYTRLTLPLQLLSSRSAAAVIQFFGGSVYQDGNVLYLPHTTLGIAEACSGLHSMASLIVAALLLGFIECTRLRSRVLLLVLAVPFAIAVNVIRVTGTAFLADVNQAYAEGFYHAFSGWLIFLAGFAFTWAVAKMLHRWVEGNPSAKLKVLV